MDGSGKSTQAELLATALRRRGLDVVATREPGGTELGERLRDLLLGSEQAPSLVAEVHLFAAARAELVQRVIRPALADGSWVVCDRFVHSSLAYQGVARGLGIDTVQALNRRAVDGCMPDRVLVIDTPVDVAAGRRSAGPDRIEAEGPDFQRRVAAGYAQLARREPSRVRMLAGAADPETIHRAVMTEMAQLL